MEHAEVVFSDEEETEDEDSVMPSLDYKLVFGKHRGSSMRKMIGRKKTRSYLRYLLTWDGLRESTRSQITYALDHYSNLKEQAGPAKKRQKRKNTSS